MSQPHSGTCRCPDCLALDEADDLTADPLAGVPRALSAEERDALEKGAPGFLGLRAVELIDALTEKLAEAVARMTIAEARLDGANRPGRGGPG